MSVVPYDIKNTVMDGTIKDIKIEPEWNSFTVGMREDSIPFQIYAADEGNYKTIAAGNDIAFASYNFSGGNSEDIIKVAAASGTLEILGFKRGS